MQRSHVIISHPFCQLHQLRRKQWRLFRDQDARERLDVGELTRGSQFQDRSKNFLSSQRHGDTTSHHNFALQRCWNFIIEYRSFGTINENVGDGHANQAISYRLQATEKNIRSTIIQAMLSFSHECQKNNKVLPLFYCASRAFVLHIFLKTPLEAFPPREDYSFFRDKNFCCA